MKLIYTKTKAVSYLEELQAVVSPCYSTANLTLTFFMVLSCHTFPCKGVNLVSQGC